MAEGINRLTNQPAKPNLNESAQMTKKTVEEKKFPKLDPKVKGAKLTTSLNAKKVHIRFTYGVVFDHMGGVTWNHTLIVKLVFFKLAMFFQRNMF